ncbi:MAG: hypothetical protein NVSMB21_24900 [Vulcanimicrobiaceae bacterium]
MDYERRIHVPRSPEALFAFVSDDTRLGAWRDGLIASRRIDTGPADASVRRYVETLRTPLGERTATVEVVADPVARRLTFDVVEGPIRPHGEISIAAADGGSDLVYRVAYATALPIATPLDRIVFEALVASVDRSLDALVALRA